MNYLDSLDYLYSRLPMFSRVGAAAYKPGLDTSFQLAEFFNNPQNKFPSIHIGGTNGKGSTSHMLASVLQSAGYKTALYTSPHLVDFRERIKINGEKIPQYKVTEFVEKWMKSGYDGSPSFFELTMIMAFNWFAEEDVDVAVIEVGMGGRLDSTNIITPELSVITNISYDHNQFLGDTLGQIAGEKAGIIKKGVPVVIGETQAETKDVFLKKAEEENAPITFADQELSYLEIKRDEKGWNFKKGELEISVPLAGEYQQKNIRTVMEAIRRLRQKGMEISDYDVKSGLEEVLWKTGFAGRWTIVDTSPLTIADTGHNIAGLTYNFQQLAGLMKEKPDGKLRVVIGFVADKAIDKIMDLLPPDADYYVTNAQIPRALPAQQLLEKFMSKGLNARKFPDVKAAYNKAKEEASENDIIFIGGSTFIVADFLSPSVAE